MATVTKLQKMQPPRIRWTPLHAVGDESRERRASGIHPHEGRADQAELQFVEAELLLEQRKHGINGLPIGVVEEADEPEHADDLPTVGGMG